jgi:hypothetical protein
MDYNLPKKFLLEEIKLCVVRNGTTSFIQQEDLLPDKKNEMILNNLYFMHERTLKKCLLML